MDEAAPAVPMDHPALKRCSGDVGNCGEPPAYLWTGSHGGVYALCVRHCAEWRAETFGVPVLEPTRIRLLDTEVADPAASGKVAT